jgi:single-strand DNA-binding protein
MANLNSVQMIGRLTKAVEVREVRKDRRVSKFSLAVNRYWRNSEGRQQSEVCLIDCEAWNGVGERIAKFCGKGSEVFLSGYLQLQRWEVNGETRSKHVFVVTEMQLLGRAESRPSNEEPAEEPAEEEAVAESIRF